MSATWVCRHCDAVVLPSCDEATIVYAAATVAWTCPCCGQIVVDEMTVDAALFAVCQGAVQVEGRLPDELADVRRSGGPTLDDGYVDWWVGRWRAMTAAEEQAVLVAMGAS